MKTHRCPSGKAEKVLVIQERRIDRDGKTSSYRMRIYHSPEAAAEWWSRFAVQAWAWNHTDMGLDYPSSAAKKARAKKYKRRALPIFKAKFNALV